ncbi:MAG: choice-of-anchor tandem repeat GloVer-containing protein [Verrucomicrobiota bacterium]
MEHPFRSIVRLNSLLALVAGIGLIQPCQVAAQSFKTLHSFSAYVYNPSTGHYTNNDGTGPQAGWVLSGNTLYGVADSGGSANNGTVFKLDTDGTGFTTLHHFTGVNFNPAINDYTNSDGAYPDGTLALSGSTLYGTAYNGGGSNNGTVFKINVNGTGFATLHSFSVTAGSLATNLDGANPETGLAIAGNTLYGTTENGGSSGYGTVFSVSTSGTAFTNLHHFTGGNDGDTPASLIVAGDTLYGTSVGFHTGKGTVFKLSTNGTGFAVLHSFAATNYTMPPGGPGAEPNYTNSDGIGPTGLRLSGNTLYGTTYWGGANGNGTVFRINTDGTGFTNLHNFSASQTNSVGVYTNQEGTHPIEFDGLVVASNALYGTANYGGSSGSGTIFTLNTDGSGFAVLHDFSFAGYDASTGGNTNKDGANPTAGVILSGSTLYGTTKSGGTSGYGTLFSFSLGTVSPPKLTITLSGTNVILTWPTNVTGFGLQSATNLVSPTVWSNVSPAAVVVNGQNTVTNPIAVARKFYRLIQ